MWFTSACVQPCSAPKRESSGTATTAGNSATTPSSASPRSPKLWIFPSTIRTIFPYDTAKTTGYDVEGLGFAIPINEAKPIIESIIKDGYVTGRPLIGLMGRSVTEQISKAQDLPVGVYVSSVTEFGAAERAGIQAGDVLIECEGQKITTVDEINKIRDAHKPGDVLKFKLSRNGRTLDVKVTLQEEKPQEEQVAEAPSTQQIDPYSFFPWFGW